MTKIPGEPDHVTRLRNLEERIYRLEHTGGSGAPNLRDLADTNVAKAADGQTLAYDQPSGLWKAVAGGGAVRSACLIGYEMGWPYHDDEPYPPIAPPVIGWQRINGDSIVTIPDQHPDTNDGLFRINASGVYLLTLSIDVSVGPTSFPTPAYASFRYTIPNAVEPEGSTMQLVGFPGMEAVHTQALVASFGVSDCTIAFWSPDDAVTMHRAVLSLVLLEAKLFTIPIVNPV